MSRAAGLALMLVATYGLALYAFGCGGDSRAATLPTSPPVPSDPLVADESDAAPTGPEPGAPAPRRVITTPEGVSVHYPVWLDLHPGFKADMVDEIRAESTPAGTTVVVLDPGPYYAPYSPTGLAAGEWRGGQTVYVAWRGAPTGPVLPALRHELGHMIHQSSTYGH